MPSFWAVAGDLDWRIDTRQAIDLRFYTLNLGVGMRDHTPIAEFVCTVCVVTRINISVNHDDFVYLIPSPSMFLILGVTFEWRNDVLVASHTRAAGVTGVPDTSLA